MQRIATQVRGDTRDASNAAAELRTPALDRLLWVFLRLLVSDQAIGRFLHADAKSIDQSLTDLHERESQAQDAAVPEAEQADDRILRSLRDSIVTTELRKDNVVKAQSNAEFITAELDRIENKIQARSPRWRSATPIPTCCPRKSTRSPTAISQTEQTIRDLQNITGMSAEADAAPSILDAELGRRQPHDRHAHPTAKVLAGTDGVTKASALPAHFPDGPPKVAELYFSGTTSTFIITGNTFDVVRAGDASRDGDPKWLGLAALLSSRCSVAGISSSATISRAACGASRAAMASDWPRWSRSPTSGSAICAHCRAIRPRRSPHSTCSSRRTSWRIRTIACA